MSGFMEVVISLLIIIGAIFTLLGSLSLLKLPDFFMRLHGPTKASTLGTGAILVASALYFSLTKGEISVHEILITVFLFITAPVSAYMLAKAALHLKLKQQAQTQGQTLSQQEGEG
ncbi:Na+/H+ antiporter subunit G [Thiofilum flexile]|uniref:Na+/H+ antiporter subunit G n=1 Tax=Thiofilum flexile TaxID=125627 RepID=UPI0003707099|nr:Na+/H+ antiporter subunit G [Thiofilum flexile]